MSANAPVQGHRDGRLLSLVVALAGAATMTVELSAVRLLAPWFGASSGVWTNVIGVVLAALALGYSLGARLSRRARPRSDLGWVLLVGALLVAWLPALAHPVASLFMPTGVALDQAAELLAWGSLAASFVLFAPAAMTLGCVGPLAVEILGRQTPDRPGEAGGRVLAASTLGSLVGTFGTTHVFLPRLGLTLTFLLAGGMLALLGLGLLWRGGALVGGRGLGLLLGIGLSLAYGRYSPPRPGEELRLLESRQSRYQSLRVVEAGEGEEVLRSLQVNESLDSFQSVWRAQPGLLGAGYYYDHFVPPVWWQDSGEKQTWDVLVLGLGAGTTVRVLEGALPPGVELQSTGIEIDPEVISLGERWFDLEQKAPGRVVHGGLDARAALMLSAGGYDQIVLDCFSNNMEVPPHLSSTEFLALTASKLRPGGWLTVNAAGFGLEDPVVRQLALTTAHGFGERVLLARVPFSRNCVIHARREAEPPGPGSAEFQVQDQRIAQLLAPWSLPGSWAWVEPPSRAPLSDDRNPIERLQIDSITAGRRRWIEELR